MTYCIHCASPWGRNPILRDGNSYPSYLCDRCYKEELRPGERKMEDIRCACGYCNEPGIMPVVDNGKIVYYCYRHEDELRYKNEQYLRDICEADRRNYREYRQRLAYIEWCNNPTGVRWY